MNVETYKGLFKSILSGDHVEPPYDNEGYVNYVKLNKSRTSRWEKKGVILDSIQEELEAVKSPLEWIVITEPWCGDAANIVPILEKMASFNDLIQLKIVLRDSSTMIDDYLTNGSKSVPKLIVRDDKGDDLLVWGPRPNVLQEKVLELKKSDLSEEERYKQILDWYITDKGESIQHEVIAALKK